MLSTVSILNSYPCFRRQGLPEQYIRWIEFINKNRTFQVITAFGLTDPVEQGGGIPQGSPDSPDDWLYVWELLLLSIHNKFPGFTMSATTNHPLPSQRETVTAKNVAISYVDDTILAGAGAVPSQTQINHVAKFLKYAGTELNASKTKVIVINEQENTKHINIIVNDTIVPRNPEAQGERLLGIYISSDNKGKTQNKIIKEYVKEAYRLLNGKPITDEQIIYIINIAVIPKLAYKFKGSSLTKNAMNVIDTTLKKIVKHAISLPSSFPNTILHHPSFYNLHTIVDRVAQDDLDTYYKQIMSSPPESIIHEN